MTPMETPLTVSTNNPREGKQGRKLYYRLKTSIQKSGLSIAGLQPALEFPGTAMEDDIAAILVRYSKMARGIVTPIRAEDTGLMPQGYSVYVTPQGVRKDRLEGDVELANVDYICPLRDTDGGSISGEVMLQRAVELKAVGSLGYAAELLKAQEEGKEIFPVESRGKEYFIMPLTELLGDDRSRDVAYFYWFDKSQRWVLSFSWVGFSFPRDVRFLVPREEKSSVA
jgi:hypothetical protein